MKLKRIIVSGLAFITSLSVANFVYAETYSVKKSRAKDYIVNVPIMVELGRNENDFSINGYIIQVDYDETSVTPIMSTNSDGSSTYAVIENEKFSNGVSVSGLLKNEKGNQVVFAWANAEPISFTEQTELANITFKVNESVTENVPIGITVTALTNDGSVLVGDDVLAQKSKDGEIIIVSGGALIGDADGNTEITASDATTILRHVANIELIEDVSLSENSDVDYNSDITVSDATAILRYLSQLEEIE